MKMKIECLRFLLWPAMFGLTAVAFNFLGGCCCGPLNIGIAKLEFTPKYSVEVSYQEPRIPVEGNEAYFFKAVAQRTTRLMETSYSWEIHLVEYDFIAWSRFYLCKSDITGQNPKVIAELPADKFTWENNQSQTGPSGFDVSWKNHKAVTIVNRLRDNLSFIDLRTGECAFRTISDPRPRSPSAMAFDTFVMPSIEVIDDGSAVLWCLEGGLFGRIDFEGNEKVVDLRDNFPHYIEHIPAEQEKFMLNNRHAFSGPLWNETQKVFALKVWIGNKHNRFQCEEVWVYDRNLECVEKFRYETLAAVVQAKRKKQPLPFHKYSWILDKPRSEFFHFHDPLPPPIIAFELKNHVIENKQIRPKHAAAIW